MALATKYFLIHPLFLRTIQRPTNFYNSRLSYLGLKYVRNGIPSATIHTSPLFFKRRKTAEERKVDRIIQYAPKLQGEIVNVWRDITLLELSQVLNKDINYVKDLFLNQFKDPNTPITDIKVLQQGLRRGGRRMTIIGKPDNSKEEEIIEKDVFPRPPAAKSELKPRPPVVTVMGHVDHGKTTLLDALRHSNVVDQEFGGITQHIGAFSVKLDTGAQITFLDTPGHAAFTAMRARGAMVTDIVILVVAADDGVMEQTIESINMAKDAKVPILVAINKIDSPKADIERTQRMLMDIGIQVEQFGGEVQAIPISALKKQNLDQLKEALILQAELLEIGADPTGLVEAIVVESKMHPYRGKLCTLVVQRGTLKKGDVLVAGTAMCRVRALKDAEGKNVEKAPPGTPVEIEGWKELPSPGDQCLEVENERRARNVIRIRQEKKCMEKQEQDLVVISEKQAHHQKEYTERLLTKRRMGRFRLKPDGPRKPEIPKDDDPTPSLNLIIKGDVDGTLEAVLNTLDTYDSNECKMDLVHYGVGPLTETDLELAKLFKAIIYAFNVDCPRNLQEQADNDSITIKHHNVIYKLVDDVKEEINQRLPTKQTEEVLGEASILQQFEINQGRKKIPIAGCRCTKGNLRRSATYRLVRNGEVIYTGLLSEMRHLKNEVDMIKTDTECGLQLMDKTINFEPGDTLVCFHMKSEPQKTSWDPGF